jgi:DNA-directed RNA polymerase II subunit RPB1
MTVHLREQDRESQEKAKFFSTIVEHTKLADIVKIMQICFDPSDHQSQIAEDDILLKQFYEFETQMLGSVSEPSAEELKSKWIIRMEMDREKMLDKNITMDDVHFAIKRAYYNSTKSTEIHCVFSDYNADKLVFRLRVNNSIFHKGSAKKGVARPLDQSDDIYLLKNFQDNILNNIILRGVDGIVNVIPRKIGTVVLQKEDGKYNPKKDIWILDTTGTNLLDTLALDFIDYKNTLSNDIQEIYDILGIEAARQVIYNEMFDVMNFSGVYINYHHLSLLCDRMTCTKDMVSIYRSGILNDKIGPIAKATFEVHTEVLLDAARHGEFDFMRGISANVMCGQYGYYGTNAFNLLLNLEEMNAGQKWNASRRTEEIEQALAGEDTEECTVDKIRIQNHLENIVKTEELLCPTDDMDVGF